MRTASARSPTNSKQNIGGISDAEQEQIRKVLARAEAGKQSEQQRIGSVFSLNSNWQDYHFYLSINKKKGKQM